ncbi:hypothetical protein ACWCOW_40640, partial [Streptomyces sp. NPDC001939]
SSPAGAGGTSLRMYRSKPPGLWIGCFGPGSRLVLRLSGHQAGLRHDVTAFTYQALVDRQMVVSG